MKCSLPRSEGWQQLQEGMMKDVDVRELSAGIVLIVFGLFVALYAASNYSIGVPAKMGPGFFPVALGWILAGLGLVVALLAFRKTVQHLHPPPFRARPMVAVLAAIGVFSLLVDRLGLVPATFALVCIAGFAEGRYRLTRTLLLGASLALLAWLVFTVGLQMTLPAFTFLE
jgi:hypothetical protein